MISVNSPLWHGVIEMDDITSYVQVMVESRMRKREMRGDGGNYHNDLACSRIF